MKQMSMTDYEEYCIHKTDYEPTPIELATNLFDGNLKVIDKDIPVIKPVKQENPIIKVGMYIRDLYNRVYLITDMGRVRTCMGARKTLHYRDGKTQNTTINKYYKTFYVSEYINGKTISIPMDEYDVSESHENICDCLYNGDSVFTCQGHMKIVARIEQRKKGSSRIWLCEDLRSKRYVLSDRDIIRKINDYVEMRDLEVGYKVKHKLFGWFVIKCIWSNKVEVYKRDGTSFFIAKWDIIDVEER